MSRATYVLRRIDGELTLVPKSQAGPRTHGPRPEAPMVIPDIAPYKSIVTGEEISSRSRHRDHLKRHGCEEIGDNAPAWLREKQYVEKHGGRYTPPRTPDGEGTSFAWEDFDG